MLDFALRRLDGAQARELVDELADLYVPMYAEPPYNAAPKFDRARFLERTEQQTRSPGFTLVTARDDATLLGFAFGFSMAPGSWWANASMPLADMLREPKFAVIEVVVKATHRKRGIGRALLDALLEHRPEPYATLAAVTESDAYGWYLRAGWRKVAEFRVEPPFSDALVLDRLR